MTREDCKILAHELLVISGFWHRYLHVQSAGGDAEGGYARAMLETKILNGAEMARHFLAYYEPQPEGQRVTH